MAYVPEPYRLFHARSRESSQAQLVSGLINLSRHRNQSLVFDVQNAYQLDRNILSEIDLLPIKEPAPLGSDSNALSSGATLTKQGDRSRQ